jgi:cytochrome c biogenesis protein CcdA
LILILILIFTLKIRIAAMPKTKNIIAALIAITAISAAAPTYGGDADAGNGNGNGNGNVNDTANVNGNVLELYFFGSATCGECQEIKHSLLYPIGQELAGRLKINFHDVESVESSELMFRMEKQYNITAPAPQELFFPDTALLGYESIMAHGRAMIEEYLNDPQRRLNVTIDQPAGDVNAALKERFGKFTFIGIVAAALVDAVNPCAIATIIFLVSFLATQKRKRSEVLMVGFAFSATVFATYLLLGIGAFKVITALDHYFWVSRAIKWSAAALAAFVGVYSLVDAIRFKKSGDAKDIKLQLPKSVKLRIHKIITENMKGKRLIIGTVVTGFLVTLLEAVCTGQVYLPTIVLMTRSTDGSMQLTGWLYLIMYNFIFVVPLLAVMIAAYFGMSWNQMSKIMQKHLTLLKVALGVVMIAMALYLVLV